MSFIELNTNFGVGFAAGVVSGVLGHRAWLALQRRAAREQERLETTGRTRTPNVNRRYINELIQICQRSHLAGDKIDLTELVVEPHFMRAPELVGIQDEDVARNIFEVVPRIHDFPYLHAAYNIPTLTIENLGRGERAMALLGLPGSGRTTALLTIALWSLGQIDFEAPADAVQDQIDQMEAELSPEERTERIRRRILAVQAAQQRVRREERGDDDEFDEDALSATAEFVPTLRQHVPMYIHLANLSTTGFRGFRVDPAEPLVRAMQAHMTRNVTRKTMPRSIYRVLNRGRGLVLIDGLDEVTERERPEKIAWIKAFYEEYGKNFMIIATQPSGYYELQDTGIAPIYLRPHSDLDMGQTAEKWANKWREIADVQIYPPDETVDELKRSSRALNAFDMTLKTWSTYEAGAKTPGGWVMDYLRRQLPEADNWLPNLKRLAAIQLDEGYITRSRLVALEAANPISTPSKQKRNTMEVQALSEADIVSLDEQAETEVTEETRRTRLIGREQGRILRTFEKAGLLLRFRGGRYQFQHPMIAAYLGGLALQDGGHALIERKADEPTWDQAIAYAAEHTPIDIAVAKRLQSSKDVLYTNVLGVTRWMGYLQQDTEWRGKLLRYLGNLFVAEHQYSLVRERIIAALVSSRDEGAQIIFREALDKTHPDVIRLGCLAVGAFRDTESIGILEEWMQQDHPDVPIAATLALGAMGVEDANRILRQTLQGSDNEDVQRTIAETFALDPSSGYLTLYDTISNEETDILAQRAAIFGLGRISANWALIAIDDVINDETKQYFVKSAATEVLNNLYGEEKQGAHAYPAPTAVPWLLEWAQGEIAMGNIPPDIDGLSLITYALEQTNDPDARQLAAATAGQLAILDATRQIYGNLNAATETNRDTAYRALGELQEKMGQPLPA